ncbi:hypothetical protein BH10BAC5_BH10BAC5_04230 [soil metagenome]
MNRLNYIINSTILICLAIQIVAGSFSIAVSSIAFGIWGGLWILQTLFIDRKLNYDKSLFREIRWINIFIVVLILADLVSRIFAFYPDGALEGFKRNLLYLIFFASVIKIIDFETLRKVLIACVAATAVIAFLEVGYFFIYLKEELIYLPFNQIRIDYLNHPLTLSEIKMLFFVQLFPLLFWKRNIIIEKKYIVLMFLPLLTSIFLSQSRTVYVAIYICILIYGFYYNWKFAVGFIIISILLAMSLPEGMFRVQSIFNSDDASASSRALIWQNGLAIFRHNWLIGVGDNNIMQVCKFYMPEFGKDMEEFAHLHSNPIMILATSGIIGAIGYIGLFTALILRTVKLFEKCRDHNIKQLLFGSILVQISFQITGFTEWNFGDAEVFNVLMFLMAIPFLLHKFFPEEFYI